MPVLSNPKWERFAQGLAQGMSQTAAYADAGYRPDSGAANRLSAKVRVKERVTELLGQRAQGVEVTLEWLIDKLEEARALAMRIEQPASAVGAAREMAVLTGLRIEKSEQHISASAQDWTEAAIDQQIAALSRTNASRVVDREETAPRHEAQSSRVRH